MAFKRTTFDTPRAPICPYAYHDKMHFAREFPGKTCVKGTVTAGLIDRLETFGLQDKIVDVSHNGKTFELVLKGQRAKDWTEAVYSHLSARRVAMLGDDLSVLTENDWDKADAVKAEVEVEGFWKKRWFRARDGEWSNTLQFHVARFTHAGVTKGRLPTMA